MTFTLTAKKREKNADKLRAEGFVPAVVYGPHIESFSVAIPQGEFEKMYEEAGESNLIDLQVEGQDSITVLVHDMQLHPINRVPYHIDFRAVTMGEEMDVSITLNFIGVAPAEKEQGGTLFTNMDMLDVRCLPKDLVDHIDVDLSVLETFDNTITVADLHIPEGMTSLMEEDQLVVKVTAPMSEDELAALEESGPASIEDVAVEGDEKKQEAEASDEDTEK